MKVVLDIETLQAPREEWARLAGLEDVDREGESHEPTDLFLQAEARERRQKLDEMYEKSSYDGTFSRVICIGLLLFDEGMNPQGSLSWYGSGERELLRHFWEKLGALRPSLFITHNGLGFDLPFLKKRSVIQQVRPSVDLSLARFRTHPVFDTMAVWSNWEARGWIKLDVLARALDVETKSGSGGQVSELWAKGEREGIARYCLQDAYVTYACYCRMTFQDPLPSHAVLGQATLIEVL